MNPNPANANLEPELIKPSVFLDDELQMTLLLDSAPADVADLQAPVWKTALELQGRMWGLSS